MTQGRGKKNYNIFLQFLFLKFCEIIEVNSLDNALRPVKPFLGAACWIQHKSKWLTGSSFDHLLIDDLSLASSGVWQTANIVCKFQDPLTTAPILDEAISLDYFYWYCGLKQEQEKSWIQQCWVIVDCWNKWRGHWQLPWKYYCSKWQSIPIAHSFPILGQA